MSDDPHRDALAAALARIDSLEQENRALRDQPASAAPQPIASRPIAPPVQDPIDHAIDETLSQFSKQLDAQPAADILDALEAPRHDAHAKGAKRPVRCVACGRARTVEAQLKKPALSLTVAEGLSDLRVARARVCADCGHVSFVIDDRSRVWLDTNYIQSLLAER